MEDLEERNGLDPISFNCGAALGILEHFRHLPVLTHPFLNFFLIEDEDFSEHFEDQDVKIHLKHPGKEGQQG